MTAAILIFCFLHCRALALPPARLQVRPPVHTLATWKLNNPHGWRIRR